ncbi:MAG: hypothetical protein ACREP9_20485 [Candidatus Dormibacteraceae bacterium]
MDRKTAAVVRGFTKLNDAQRQEVVQEINSYLKGSYQTKSLIGSGAERRVFEVSMGPLGDGCPCCGR